jgi:hypothetical protein
MSNGVNKEVLTAPAEGKAAPKDAGTKLKRKGPEKASRSTRSGSGK